MAMIYTLAEKAVEEGKDQAEIDMKKSFFFTPNHIS
jgi:hypothetical protein